MLRRVVLPVEVVEEDKRHRVDPHFYLGRTNSAGVYLRDELKSLLNLV